ncbi:MAG TPA: hypothetical protein VN376_06515 [Longilinea sp.]|nr:hypothetical protein [Longilinea sp.]
MRLKQLTLGLILFAELLAACTAPTPVETPTVTPSITATQTVTHTPTPTSRPIPTRIPTLPFEEAMARIDELNATNGGCEYPCFWGITPGVTTYDEALEILVPLIEEDEERWVYSTTATNHFDLVDTIEGSYDENTVSLTLSERVVARISVQSEFLMTDVLQRLGPPDDVYYSFANNILIDPGYHIILDYGSSGIYVTFYDETGAQYDRVDHYLVMQVCGRYVGLGGTGLYFWDPSKPDSAPDVFSNYGDALTNIRDGMGMTPQEFYDLYADPNSTNCLTDPTPAFDLNDQGG